jgi:hypothetical protein
LVKTVQKNREESGKKMRSILILLIAIVIIAFILFEKKGEELVYVMNEYNQEFMDVERINDINEIAQYIEEYKEKTGNYPLMGEKDIPVYVYITTEQQQIDANKYGGPPIEHHMVTVDAFTDILAKGLGKQITLPRDPQEMVSGARPNFYTYMVKEGFYDLSTHLYYPQPFAYKIKDDWHVLAIGNKTNKERKIWAYADIMKKPAFVEKLQ